MIIRTEGDARELLEPAKEVLRALDPEIAMYDVTTLEGLVDEALAGRRFTMSLFSLFAGVALLLTIAESTVCWPSSSDGGDARSGCASRSERARRT